MSVFSWVSPVLFDIQNDIKRQCAEKVFVAFSGGLDSTFLLHQALKSLGAEQVTAIHINHGLSENATQWQAHCQRVCDELGCRLIAMKLEIKVAGQGLEAAARDARYKAFAEIIPHNGWLLLGHHLDDQVETYFLRLFRGAGPTGLKSMAQTMSRDHYRIFRPMLNLSRPQIENIANELGFSWIEDESNKNERFDRNFLRQSVLPLIETRWPAYREKIVQAINLTTQPTSAESNFDVDNELKHRLSHDGGFKMVQIDDFSEAQMMSLLHAWLRSLGLQTPSSARLQTIVKTVIHARMDAQPEVRIGDGAIRRHGPALYWVQDQMSPSEPPSIALNEVNRWAGVGEVSVCIETSDQPKLKHSLPNLHWRLRKGEESMRPFGRSKSRDLKRLMQEYRVKPWLRDRTPLLFSGDDLVAVGDSIISADHLALDGESGIRVNWKI